MRSLGKVAKINGLIVVVTCFLIYALHRRYQNELNEHKKNFQEETKIQAVDAARNLELRFQYFYQALRTMSLLPGVIHVDRYAKNFDENAKKTLQQIYNNAYLNVKMSEIYLLPSKLDPDKIDPLTKKAEEPIITFDEFIVDGAAKPEEKAIEKLEEVEIYEYRLMKAQLEQLFKLYPTKSSFKGIDVPAIMGKEVVTCDNSDFTKADLESKNDFNRLGLVYTLPVYDDLGNLNGGVSGVLRSKILLESLPKLNFKLVNSSWGINLANEPASWLNQAEESLLKLGQDVNLISSGSLSLQIKDTTEWKLLYAFDDAQFWAREGVASSKQIFWLSSGCLCVVALGLMFGFYRNAKYQETLEQKVESRTQSLNQRNQDMGLILNNAKDGFVAVQLTGDLETEHSAILETWFGSYSPGTKIWDYLGKGNAKWIHGFSFGFSQVVADILPFEMAIDQLPNSLEYKGKSFQITLREINDQKGKLSKLLCVVSDISESIERERLEKENREKMNMFQNITNDKAAFLEFLGESQNLVNQIITEKDVGALKRLIHTVKGNAAIYGMTSISEFCHEWESKLEESGPESLNKERVQLKKMWSEKLEGLQNFLGENKNSEIAIDAQEYNSAINAIKQGLKHEQIAELLASWRLEPTIIRLKRLSEQCKRIAEKISKPVEIVIESGNVRMDSQKYSGFWSALIHVARNALDHGLESPEERILQRKPKVGKITLRTLTTAENILVEIQDDGQGIQWEKVRTKAKEKNLPHETKEDLIQALFTDGLSTKDQVSDLSGRGVGMSAVKETVLRKNGQIEIDSQAKVGTTFRFVFPKNS